MTWGELLRICRKNRGLTQSQLAERTLTTQATITAIETGRYIPRVDKYSEILEACGYELGIREKRSSYTIEEMVNLMEKADEISNID